MEVAIAHRNQNSTGPHAVEGASLIVGGIVRIDGQRRLGKHQGGLFPLCKKIFRFVAKLCQASYESIAKTTSRSHAARLPDVAGIQGRGAGRRPHHPDTSPSRQPQHLRYPSPMKHACKALDQHPVTTAALAWSASTSTRGSASDSRRLFLTGAKLGTKFCSWHESASYGHPLKTTSRGTPAPAPAAKASSKDMRRPRWG